MFGVCFKIFFVALIKGKCKKTVDFYMLINSVIKTVGYFLIMKILLISYKVLSL